MGDWLLIMPESVAAESAENTGIFVKTVSQKLQIHAGIGKPRERTMNNSPKNRTKNAL